MKIDESFKKPGSVPFKWEIRPGVPKLQSGCHQFECHQNHSFPETPTKLKPPPAGLRLHPNLEPQTPRRVRSFQSSPRTLSDRFSIPGLTRSNVVSSARCFLLKNTKKRGGCPESDNHSNLEMWSVSSRNSVSPFPSSFPSQQSSPRPVSGAEWTGFGLF